METGKIVRVCDNENNVQIMCSDNCRLISAYFEHNHFMSFYNVVKAAGLKLNGLLISFDRDIVRVPSLGNNLVFRFR